MAWQPRHEAAKAQSSQSKHRDGCWYSMYFLPSPFLLFPFLFLKSHSSVGMVPLLFRWIFLSQLNLWNVLTVTPRGVSFRWPGDSTSIQVDDEDEISQPFYTAHYWKTDGEVKDEDSGQGCGTGSFQDCFLVSLVVLCQIVLSWQLILGIWRPNIHL